MPDESFQISPVQADLIQAQAASQAQALKKYAISQQASIDFTAAAELDAFNPFVMARRFETLETKAKKKEESEKADKKEKKILEIKRLEAISEQYQRKNPELQSRILLLLRARITNEDTLEEILRKVLEVYTDLSLADEALDYLLEITEGDLRKKILDAKKALNNQYAREIKAGRNMGAQAREFSKQGLGSPTGLRNMYRDLTGNPREPVALFEELSSSFTYDKMKSVIDFILHALGSDLKSKGPSISRAELHRLMTEARSLQAILGVYRYFKSRMKLIQHAFQRMSLALPMRITFETLAKQFMKFIQERYPSQDRARQLAQQLGLSEELAAQIIIYTQLRDAVRQVAPKLFKSEQHRQDVLLSFIETIEAIDAELEEEEEKEKEEEEEEKKE